MTGRRGNTLGNGSILVVAFWAIVAGGGLLVGFGAAFAAAMGAVLLLLAAAEIVVRVRDRRPTRTEPDAGLDIVTHTVGDRGPR